jgi:23S rRNA (uridine2552-2'-O)-methyltransferase
MKAVRELRGIARRQDEYALSDPYDARTVDEPLFPLRGPLWTLRDPSPSEHQVADPRRDGPRGTRDIVGQEYALSLVSFNRHVELYGYSHIIAFRWVARNYSPPVNMLGRRVGKGYGVTRSSFHTMGKAWVKARRHDRFYRAAKRQAYRSRAAIKLSQIDRRHGLFREGDVVVDLGAAPGGWSQVARERVGPKGRVIAVDLTGIAPLEGVEVVRGDFTQPETQARVFEALRRPADVVMSDLSPKLSGHRSTDVSRALDLAETAFAFAVRALRPGGQFLVKVFQGEGYREFLQRVSERFERVGGVKPGASTRTSPEIYVVGQGRL